MLQRPRIYDLERWTLVTVRHEIESLVRDQKLEGKGTLKVKMVLTAEGTDLKHVVDGEIDLN